jgi:hypothetical protein
MFGFQLHWGAARHGVRNPSVNTDVPQTTMRGTILTNTEWGRTLRAKAPVAAARALVFDTWVGQADHDHPSNIAWGINPDDENDNDILFFDYEMAFGVGGWAKVVRPPFPAELLNLIDHNEVALAAACVANYDEDRLRQTVNRIPKDHLPTDQKADIIKQLLARRALVPAALGI